MILPADLLPVSETSSTRSSRQSSSDPKVNPAHKTGRLRPKNQLLEGRAQETLTSTITPRRDLSKMSARKRSRTPKSDSFPPPPHPKRRKTEKSTVESGLTDNRQRREEKVRDEDQAVNIHHRKESRKQTDTSTVVKSEPAEVVLNDPPQAMQKLNGVVVDFDTMELHKGRRPPMTQEDVMDCLLAVGRERQAALSRKPAL